MGLLNYSTSVPAEKTVGEIIQVLVKHGGERIIMDYDPDTHELAAVAWKVKTRNGVLPYRLPANVPGVAKTLKRQHELKQVDSIAVREGQAARVAWRIVKTWVVAQMAFHEAGMVDFEEVFLPYMLVEGGQTLYQSMQTGGFKALMPGGDL